MTIDWFRKPVAGDPGTLNACYNALDRHVVRGKAEAVAVEIDGRGWTYADLLAEVGAFAGVLKAFGVGIGHEVVLLDAPPREDTVVQLACARVGAVLFREASPNPALAVVGTADGHDVGDVTVVTIDDSGELDWATAMRAGRTDPAACAEVLGDGLLRVIDGTAIATADHLLAVAAGHVVDPVLTPLLSGETLVLAAASD